MAVKIEGRDPEISYEGAVLDTYERNGYDDSDFFAVVWDEASKAALDCPGPEDVERWTPAERLGGVRLGDERAPVGCPSFVRAAAR